MQCNGSCSNNQSACSPVSVPGTDRHPCYSLDAHYKFARMHLPVAPACNISCNYCNRKFDCVHESRPGVTSEILTPVTALIKYKKVRAKIDNLSVIGIAGPGDALANWPETRLSIELIRDRDPDLVFCLSTNGLLLPQYAREITELGIRHVTVTVNCLDPAIGAKIYRFVNYRSQRYDGEHGAGVLIANQLAGISELAARGVLVKVNIVMIKGINDNHIPTVVKKVKELGAHIANIMPLIPAGGSVFENYPQTNMKELNAMRDLCSKDLPQMRHCRQCRADAIGLLGEDRANEFAAAKVSEPVVPEVGSERFKVAVTSRYGLLVDQHFGHAAEFAVYEGDGAEWRLVEKRPVEKYCAGVEECDSEETRREKIIGAISDCDAVLTMRIGYNARQRLQKKGIVSVEYCDSISNGLLYAARKLKKDKSKEAV